ncbi:hypothetical protein C475_05340 [Halosimplex carlsbadense 2-9-1]|uniref:Uncharacterized protein n=1 Tax=Halosimplex carlsbadense 2-9-1 TaxID=797114 RepID=M0CZZ6_9EURY|nr:hypothetical protein [Halosimplex carlsbadense]ELZ28203.1 hypothetical protein C475_05340 [Halosimplex carlsbadense 2-9-1]
MPSNSTADRSVRTTAIDEPSVEGDGDECRDDGGEGGDDDLPVRRATRIMRLLKLAATTLAALAGAAKALGLV